MILLNQYTSLHDRLGSGDDTITLLFFLLIIFGVGFAWWILIKKISSFVFKNNHSKKITEILSCVIASASVIIFATLGFRACYICDNYISSRQVS